MSRYDKYEPMTGGFRAPLAANFPVADLGKVLPVGLDANGRVVVGLGNTGYKGVIVLTSVKNASDIVDVMQDGDIVEFAAVNNDVAAVAGTNYFADATDNRLRAGTGARTATAPIPAGGTVATAGTVYVGHTVEATRLVVRMRRDAV